MKKKIVLIFLISVLLIAGLFILTGCGNTEKSSNDTNKVETSNNNDSIVIEDYRYNYSTTFKNDNHAFKINEDDKFGISTPVDNESLGITLNLYNDEMSKEELERHMRTEKQNDWEEYLLEKEYTWNGFKAFIYRDSNPVINFIAILEENGDKAIILKGSIVDINSDGGEYDRDHLMKIFDGDEVQNFFNTMEFKK